MKAKKKINVIKQQEKDLKEIKTKGYADNRIISDDSNKGYILTELPPESELGF